MLWICCGRKLAHVSLLRRVVSVCDESQPSILGTIFLLPVVNRQLDTTRIVQFVVGISISGATCCRSVACTTNPQQLEPMEFEPQRPNFIKPAFHDTDTDSVSPDTPTSLRPTHAISLRGSSGGNRACRT